MTTVIIKKTAALITISGLIFGPFVSSWKNLMSPALLEGIPTPLSRFFLALKAFHQLANKS
jgi:hypothetical protein